MFSELKISPRSVSSREHALRMITASGSSSSSTTVGSPAMQRLTGAGAIFAGRLDAPPVPSSARADGADLAEKSWSWVSRLIARRPELDSRSVSVLTWSASLLAKKRLAAVLISASVSPTDTMALASTRTLIGRGVPVVVDVGGLVGDVEIDVDDLARDRGAGGEQRDLLRLAGSAIDHRAAVQPAHEPNRAGLDVAQELGDDHGHRDRGRIRRRRLSAPRSI